MKIKILIISAISILPIKNAYPATAMYCTTNIGGTESQCPDCEIITQTIECGTSTYCDCSKCKNNGTPTSKTIQTGPFTSTTISECPKSLQGGDIIISGTCPDACPSETWADVSGQNYQTRCGGSLRLRVCEYRCRAGFYGTNQDCTQCPVVDNNLSTKQYGTSTAGSNSAITNCFLAPGTYYDTTGTFSITGGNCGYTN